MDYKIGDKVEYRKAIGLVTAIFPNGNIKVEIKRPKFLEMYIVKPENINHAN